MGEKQTVKTPAGFITGYVHVSGIIGRGQCPNAKIIASLGEFSASDDIPVENNPKPYLLVVHPGRFSVQASIGELASKKFDVTVSSGETTELDFHFGKV